MTRRCKCCGKDRVRKTIRAVIVRDGAVPRVGLVCQLCASCGILVVPGRLRILPEKPRKVPRAALRKSAAWLTPSARIEPDEDP